MEYGIFTSQFIEIAQTKQWTLCLYGNPNPSIIGAQLYRGLDDQKTLVAIVERHNKESQTLYAYAAPNGQVFSNDSTGVWDSIGRKFDCDIKQMEKVDTIQISEPYTMASVSDKGIEYCLKQWRMGTFYEPIHNGINFQMVTNKVEYIFTIQNDDCNIYCGASVNIPCDKGLFGSEQYFRIRNYQDNSKPFCRFECNLGNPIIIPRVPEYVCESGKCTVTQQGIYWPIKRYDENEIVLSGCDDDEYVYSRIRSRSEYFCFL